MYRQGGTPSHVQINSPGGNSIPLPIEEYESGGVLPDWRELPNVRQYKALSLVHKLEQGDSAFINPADAEEFADRDRLVPVCANVWQLTDAGKRFL
jgi:hypothetical protein